MIMLRVTNLTCAVASSQRGVAVYPCFRSPLLPNPAAPYIGSYDVLVEYFI